MRFLDRDRYSPGHKKNIVQSDLRKEFDSIGTRYIYIILENCCNENREYRSADGSTWKLILATIMRYLGKRRGVGGRQPYNSHRSFSDGQGRPNSYRYPPSAWDSDIGAILISWFVACPIRRHRHAKLSRGQRRWPALEASRVPIFGSVAYAADVISGVAAPSSLSRSSAARRFTTHPHGW